MSVKYVWVKCGQSVRGVCAGCCRPLTGSGPGVQGAGGVSGARCE